MQCSERVSGLTNPILVFGNKKAAKFLKNGHAKGKSMTLDTAFVGVPIPLCKGAERYFKEIGAL